RSVRTATISLDVVLARIMLPTAEASHYAVANHFALVGTVYLGLFYNTFLPSIMREAAQGADALRRLISVAIRRATRVGAGLALLATIIAPPFFSVLLGPKFHATIGLFQLLVWSLYALGIAGVYNSVLIAFGRQTRLAMIATIALSVNLALNLLLLPTLGAPGASVAMVVAETVALALAYRATVPLLRTGP